MKVNIIVKGSPQKKIHLIDVNVFNLKMYKLENLLQRVTGLFFVGEISAANYNLITGRIAKLTLWYHNEYILLLNQSEGNGIAEMTYITPIINTK